MAGGPQLGCGPQLRFFPVWWRGGLSSLSPGGGQDEVGGRFAPGSAIQVRVVKRPEPCEAPAGAKLDDDTEKQVVALLLRSTHRSDIAALQIDFDATRSQRRFYSDVLRKVRQQMPASLPLSMTALASWCSYDDWIGL